MRSTKKLSFDDNDEDDFADDHSDDDEFDDEDDEDSYDAALYDN